MHAHRFEDRTSTGQQPTIPTPSFAVLDLCMKTSQQRQHLLTTQREFCCCQSQTTPGRLLLKTCRTCLCIAAQHFPGDQRSSGRHRQPRLDPDHLPPTLRLKQVGAALHVYCEHLVSCYRPRPQTQIMPLQAVTATVVHSLRSCNARLHRCTRLAPDAVHSAATAGIPCTRVQHLIS